MRVLIGVPSYEQMPADFVRCLLKLQERLQKKKIAHEVLIAAGSLIYIAREKIVERAIEGGFTHVLWIDSDQVFGEDVLEKLAAPGQPFVTALIRSRHAPYNYCVCDTLHHVVEIAPKYAFKVFMCGFGCVLTEVEVLKAVAQANGGRCFTPSARLGEDFQFCERAQDLGIPIWCEPSARVGHIGKVIVWPDKIPT